MRETIQENWANHLHIIQIGPWTPSKRVGFAVYSPGLQVTQSRRLSNRVSVFTAEVVALIWTVQWVEEVRPQQVVICSDSAAALMALQGGRSHVRPDLICELQTALYRAELVGSRVGFLWV